MTAQTMSLSEASHAPAPLIRFFGWANLAVMLVFLVNNVLTVGFGFPGPGISPGGEGGAAGFLQAALYVLALLWAGWHVLKSPGTALRLDSVRISDFNAFLIRAAFWCVLIVGLVDMAISFMRVENLLEPAFGEEMAKNLGRSQFRGPFVHMPLLALGVVMAVFTRTLGFHWLALLIVAAELLIVLMRFIFSYEQPFMADLVRFWYGALFLFASAYTLLEEGHVRVDIFYAGFKDRTKGFINAVGSIFLGTTLCWAILIVGMGQKTSIINSPVLNFETTQSGFGLYVKYMMAGFLGIFAITMMIQFVSYLFAAVADYRGEPGKRAVASAGAH